jgi:protein involved in polysaccharide export with SLBB domain
MVACGLMLLTGCCCAPRSQNALLHSTQELLQRTPPNLPSELNKQVLRPYVVEPGDVLLVQPADTGEQRVLTDGTINLGRFGVMVVANKTLPEIEVQVRATIANDAKEAGPVSVRLVASHSKFYYVLGEVNAPGIYPLTGRETVLDGIAMACGPTCRAAKCRMILSRPTAPDCCRIVVPICYDEIVQHGDTTTNYQLMPGDRIFVPSQSLCEACFGWFKKEDHTCGCHTSGACPLSASCAGDSASAVTPSRGAYNFGTLTTPLKPNFTWVQTDAPVNESAPAPSPAAEAQAPQQPSPIVAPANVLEMSKDAAPVQTLPLEAPKPISLERPRPVAPETPKPIGMQMLKPITSEAPAPMPMEMPKPATVESPKPVKIECVKPATVESPRPMKIECLQPATVETPKPMKIECTQPGATVESPKPMKIECVKPATVEGPKPIKIESVPPVTVESPKPTKIEGMKPATAEAPKPIKIESIQPVTVESPKPTKIEGMKPATAESPKPIKIESVPQATVESPKPIKIEGVKATAETPKPIKIESVQPAAVEGPKPTKIEGMKPATAEAPKPIMIEGVKPVTVEASQPGAAAPPTVADLFRQIIFAGHAPATPGTETSAAESIPTSKPATEKPAKPKESETSQAPPAKADEETKDTLVSEKVGEGKEATPVSAEQNPAPTASTLPKTVEECGPVPAGKEEAKTPTPAEPAALPALQDEAEPLEPQASASGSPLPESRSLDAFLSLFFGTPPPTNVKPISRAEMSEK